MHDQCRIDHSPGIARINIRHMCFGFFGRTRLDYFSRFQNVKTGVNQFPTLCDQADDNFEQDVWAEKLLSRNNTHK
jgi:hypothetical protein